LLPPPGFLLKLSLKRLKLTFLSPCPDGLPTVRQRHDCAARLLRLAPVVDDVYVRSVVALFVRTLHGDALSDRGEAVLAHQAVGLDPGKVCTDDK
jgi:hypothetical protein